MFLDFCGVTGVGGWFGMGDWVLTQGSLLCRDDNFGGDCFGMGDWFLTQRSLLCRDDKVWVGGGLTNLDTTHHYFVLPRYEESLR